MTTERFNGTERRAYVRLEKSLPVRLKITGNPTNQTFTLTTKNISQGGICLEIQKQQEALLRALSAANHSIGIDLNTLIPQNSKGASERPLWVRGRVDWTRELDEAARPLQVGLEFEDLTEEARKRIRDYIVNQFLRQYPSHHKSG
ncbi:MAG: PilZ domain-containing protein [Desulfobacterales bacterium]|jgi:c-di-GMP-binding flagellar brake protein YcgR